MNNEDAFLQPIPVAQASEDVRSRFIVRTYNHLFGAIALFTLIEIVLFKSGVAERIASALMGLLAGFPRGQPRLPNPLAANTWRLWPLWLRKRLSLCHCYLLQTHIRSKQMEAT